jgi:DNA-binding transcriptional MerR regulator
VADPHLSIGEVLSLLQAEFPDVTISKIRFLESQGLIDPERTPSGYRKFYETDIERLRWILVQQRENFLPLKVIKDRLRSAEGVPADEPAPEAVPVPAGAPAAEAAPAPAPTPSPPTVRASMPAGEAPEHRPIWMADVARSAKTAKVVEAAESVALDAGPSDVSLTAKELVSAAGLTPEALRELEQYGLVVGRDLGNDTYYDGDALLVARKAAAFLGHGIDVRHLRMFKVSAEREAGFLEQVAMPLLKQRNPEARRQAVDLVEELADLGGDLRAALLRSNLRRHLDRS